MMLIRYCVEISEVKVLRNDKSLSSLLEKVKETGIANDLWLYYIGNRVSCSLKTCKRIMEIQEEALLDIGNDVYKPKLFVEILNIEHIPTTYDIENGSCRLHVHFRVYITGNNNQQFNEILFVEVVEYKEKGKKLIEILKEEGYYSDSEEATEE